MARREQRHRPVSRQGDLATARVVGDRAARVARAYGLGRELGIALQLRGTVQLEQRELDGAAASIADALTALRRDPRPFWIARALELLGLVECARGRTLHAARLFGAAERRRERMGAGLFHRLRAALDLYHGEFLEGEDAGDLHLEERDRL
jgi:hypothetical protein